MNTLIHFFRSLDLEQSLVLLFMVMVGTEWIMSKINRIHIHHLRDSVNNMLIGCISFFFDFLFTMLMLPVWYYIYHHFPVFHFKTEGWVILILLFILVDLSEYWFHRLSHEINILWQAHVVHHQSEFFNLTVGVRTSLFVPLFNFFIYSLFPLFGFNPETTLLIIFIQGIYQLLIHTELIGKLGILEKMIVTPSAHRVHHGKNEIYIDKNYGKFLIIWDQMFGTYQAETEQVEYGITTPLKKSGAIHSIFEPFRQLIVFYRNVKSPEKRKVLLFKTPDEAYNLIKREDLSETRIRKGKKSAIWFFTLILIMGLGSCTITKRKYMPGFYIHRKGNAVTEIIHTPTAKQKNTDTALSNIELTTLPENSTTDTFCKLVAPVNSVSTLEKKNKRIQHSALKNISQKTRSTVRAKVKSPNFYIPHSAAAENTEGLLMAVIIACIGIFILPPLLNLTERVPWWLIVLNCLAFAAVWIYLLMTVEWPMLFLVLLAWHVLFIVLFLVISRIA